MSGLLVAMMTLQKNERGFSKTRPLYVLDVSSTVEPVQLNNQLQHGSLNFVVSTCTVIESRSTLDKSSAVPETDRTRTTHERIHFIEKDDARLFTPCHFL